MRFTPDHEFIHASGETATVGISEHAQHQLGDIVYVELPALGAKFNKGDPAAVVESVKAASDVFAPASGEVVAVNDKLGGNPSLVNDDAQGEGWLFKLKLSAPGELDALMDAPAYAEYLKTVA
ncbi:MAG: glycine cleavage system protein GcvH [Pseudomonadota bacterium]|nr:glycine cleavage system protein GcvH [Pseudomonadota bacterium]